MLTEFVGLQMSREELSEVHAALLKQALVEDETRRERGLEPVERRPLLDKIEMLLGLDEEVAHLMDHRAEDELWEYAWFAFTDEWAWYRAQQELVAEGQLPEAEDERRKRIEALYRKHFERYVAEVAMKDSGRSKTAKTRQARPEK